MELFSTTITVGNMWPTGAWAIVGSVWSRR